MSKTYAIYVINTPNNSQAQIWGEIGASDHITLPTLFLEPRLRVPWSSLLSNGGDRGVKSFEVDTNWMCNVVDALYSSQVVWTVGGHSVCVCAILRLHLFFIIPLLLESIGTLTSWTLTPFIRATWNGSVAQTRRSHALYDYHGQKIFRAYNVIWGRNKHQFLTYLT